MAVLRPRPTARLISGRGLRRLALAPLLRSAASSAKNTLWRLAMQFRELDPRTTIESQLTDTEGPLILMNVFTLESHDSEEFVKAWTAESEFFKKKPGYVSAQLHEGVGGSTLYVNYAVWESAASFAAAFHEPEFKEIAKKFPASVIALPHLVRKMAVPSICVA